MLQQRVAALEQERNEFIRLKQQLEAEFNQKRAKFKELYLSKEGRRARSHQFSSVCKHDAVYMFAHAAFLPLFFLPIYLFIYL